MALGVEVGPDALHAAALLDLESQPDEPRVIARAIQQLHRAARLSPRPSRVLSDLAAAYLLDADATSRPGHLLSALNSAEESVSLDASNSSALFNLALALDELGLKQQAGAAWRRSATAEKDPDWRSEALRRASDLSRSRDTKAPSIDDGRSVLEAYALAAPQAARILGFETWLGSWARAWLAGASDSAHKYLGAASTLGKALADHRGDESLFEEVEAIRSATATRAQSIALAHAVFDRGAASYARAQYSAAAATFDSVLHLPGVPLPLRLWAMSNRGAALVYGNDSLTRERLLAAVIATADSQSHPTVIGRAHWARGTAALRGGRFEIAQREYGTAHAFFVQAHERQFAAATGYLAAEATLDLGDRAAALEQLIAAAAVLSSGDASVWLHDALYVLAKLAEGMGLPHAALRLAAEDVQVATRLGPAIYVGEARISHARYLDQLRRDGVGDELRGVDSLIPLIRDSLQHGWLQHHKWSVEAATLAATEPKRAVALFDSVVAFFERRSVTRLLPALVGRAEAHAVLKDERATYTDLARAAELIGRERASIDREGYRASLLADVHAVYDRLVLLRLAAGDNAGALRYMEESRSTAVTKSTTPGTPRPPIENRQRGIELAVIGDTLITWIVRDATIVTRRSHVDRSALLSRIASTRDALESRASVEVLQPRLAQLYSILLRPIEDYLGAPGDMLSIAVDGPLIAVPYAALFDSDRRRYVIEDHPIRVTTTLADGPRTVASPGTIGDDLRALVVSAPAVDYSKHPELAPLPGAAREASPIAADYKDGLVLTGSAANATAVGTTLGRVDVFHYAGHAIADDERPERSYLLLASNGKSDRADRLTATDIEQLNLHAMRLVVLAACQTLEPGSGNAGGFRGLAAAFRHAGARGVIGSLWRVDDDLTSTLMVRLHDEYRRSGDAMMALRNAQLRLLHDSSTTLRSPAAWGAFQYTGQ